MFGAMRTKFMRDETFGRCYEIREGSELHTVHDYVPVMPNRAHWNIATHLLGIASTPWFQSLLIRGLTSTNIF